MIEENKCNIRYLSGILYCASQNRDNRKCCADLDLNAPQLQVCNFLFIFMLIFDFITLIMKKNCIYLLLVFFC